MDPYVRLARVVVGEPVTTPRERLERHALATESPSRATLLDMARLSPLERLIVDLVDAGGTRADIAEALELDDATIRVLHRRARAKLAVMWADVNAAISTLGIWPCPADGATETSPSSFDQPA